MYATGTKTEVAEALKISRPKLYRWLDKNAPDLKWPIKLETFQTLYYAFEHDLKLSEVKQHKIDNINSKKSQIKQELDMVANSYQPAIKDFIQELGTDIDSDSKSKVIQDLKADYLFYSGLIKTYKFSINAAIQRAAEKNQPIQDTSETEKQLIQVQNAQARIIKALTDLNAFEDEPEEIESFTFTTKGA